MRARSISRWSFSLTQSLLRSRGSPFSRSACAQLKPLHPLPRYSHYQFSGVQTLALTPHSLAGSILDTFVTVRTTPPCCTIVSGPHCRLCCNFVALYFLSYPCPLSRLIFCVLFPISFLNCAARTCARHQYSSRALETFVCASLECVVSLHCVRMSSGALGRGSFHLVVAGVNPHRIPTYYNSAYELIQLHRAHREVTRNFLIRDKVFDNKFPGCSLANGLFKMVPNKRGNFHTRELTESIRHRTIWAQRIQQQRTINATILDNATKVLSPGQMEDRFSYRTPDAAAYFSPQEYTVANNWPNYWQHPTEKHVVPRPRWRREPELGGITRVRDAVATPVADY